MCVDKKSILILSFWLSVGVAHAEPVKSELTQLLQDGAIIVQAEQGFIAAKPRLQLIDTSCYPTLSQLDDARAERVSVEQGLSAFKSCYVSVFDVAASNDSDMPMLSFPYIPLPNHVDDLIDVLSGEIDLINTQNDGSAAQASVIIAVDNIFRGTENLL
ncbi:hypothetical protein [Marinomonas transparens]|uniref:Uncharacterized protein n=1 Tax=Marinomonas transparens TaxID=2795388 RepID=A0A934JYY5_9GAMM|nr:hypothetical protein [Marinomonas transparens]MBJ7539825.1 hypothetical protein [Marinomonas transparens]